MLDRREGEGPAGPVGGTATSSTAPGKRTLVDGIARSAASSGAPSPGADQAVAEAETGAGQVVPEHLQQAFASGGADVSGVRLHTGASSERAAESVSARAYALDQDVHFGAGQFQPGTHDGDHLIAHEVAHTVQQRGGEGRAQFAGVLSAASDPAELEADRVADAVVSGGAVPAITTAPSSAVARWADGSSADAVLRVIDHARPEQLSQIETALGDGEGSADAMVAIELPGWAGYVAHADLRPLRERAESRLAAAGTPQDPGPAPLLSGGMQGITSGRDASLRITQYVDPAQRMSRDIMQRVASGELTHLEGREAAVAERSRLRLETRGDLSRGGRATSEMIEPEGPSVRDLANRYALRRLAAEPALRERFGITTPALGDPATERALQEIRESEEVSRAIIAAAGRPNSFMTGMSRTMRVLGPAMTGAQVAVGGYRVLAADEGEHMWTAGQEISGFVGGSLGSEAGGLVVTAVGAVLVGAGVTVSAPAAIVISLVVVGGMGFAGNLAGRSVWDHTVDHASLHAFEIELARSIDVFLHASTGDRISAAMPLHGLAAGGGLGGLMDRDRRRVMDEMRRPPPAPESSGGEAP